MPNRILPPTATVLSFIDRINRADVNALGRLLAQDHVLHIFDEPPLTGREENIEAWRAYATSFPDYLIYPHRIAAAGDRVAIVGHTTGSHLGLPDDEEAKITLIWVAHVDRGLVRSWRLMEDNSANQAALGLDLV